MIFRGKELKESESIDLLLSEKKKLASDVSSVPIKSDSVEGYTVEDSIKSKSIQLEIRFPMQSKRTKSYEL